MRLHNNALRLLAHAFAAVDHGSLREAARVLRVCESGVSRSVAALEHMLDVQLFERNAHGVRLTEAGRAWVGAARVHYKALADAFDEAVRHDVDAKTLRIGVCSPLGRDMLLSLVRRFARSHPGIGLAIEDVDHAQGVAAIRKRRLDILFTNDEAAAFCRSETFWREALFVLLPAQHPLAQKAALAWTDLAAVPLLLPAEPAGAVLPRPALHQIAQEAGISVEATAASQATVIFKVQLGHGVMVAAESLAKATTVNAAVWKPLEGPDSASPIVAVWLDTNPKRAVGRLIAAARNMTGKNSGR